MAKVKKEKAPTLAQLVKLACLVIEPRCSIPILQRGLLRREGNDSSLVTTDMDVRITVNLAGGNVDRDSMIEPRALAAALGKATGFELRAGALANGARIGAEYPVADFPGDSLLALDSNAQSGRVVYPAGVMLATLDYVAPAISTEETRYYLNGIYVHAAKDSAASVESSGIRNGVRMVATDGHRLHLDVLPEPAGYRARLDNAPGAILPRATVNVIRKALALYGADALAELEWTETRMAFRLGAVCVQSKVIDGTFPDYMRVIPGADAVKQAITLTAAARQALAESVKVAAGMAERERTFVAAITASGNAIVPQWAEQAAGVVVGVNSGYLSDIMHDSDCVAGVQDFGSPIRFTYPDHPARLGVLMPMRTGFGALPSRKAAERAAAALARQESIRAGIPLQCIAGQDGVRECVAMERSTNAAFAAQCIAEPLTDAEAAELAAVTMPWRASEPELTAPAVILPPNVAAFRSLWFPLPIAPAALAEPEPAANDDDAEPVDVPAVYVTPDRGDGCRAIVITPARAVPVAEPEPDRWRIGYGGAVVASFAVPPVGTWLADTGDD